MRKRHISVSGAVANWIFLTIIAIMVLVSRVGATTMVSTNLAQLSEIAEKAFVVRIDSVTSATVQGRACDVINGTVTDTVFGAVNTSETISWNQFKLNANVMLPGMPKYQPGKKYLIFLSGPGRGAGFQSPVGLGQGAFLVSRDPTTGVATVRNAFMNSTLARGLNVEKAAEDMVQSNGRTRGLSGQARAAEVQKRKIELNGGPNASLDGIKRAAQFFHERKLQGGKPAAEYLSTTSRQLLH